MKTKHIFIITGVLSVIGCTYFESSPTYSSEAIRRAELGTLSETTPKNKGLSLPEEINLAEYGDLLKVERVTKDSIFLGFTH